MCYADIEKFRNASGTSSVMIARAAEWNTSVFRKEGKLPIFDVVRQYLKIVGYFSCKMVAGVWGLGGGAVDLPVSFHV